jgi:hypothetical protein
MSNNVDKIIEQIKQRQEQRLQKALDKSAEEMTKRMRATTVYRDVTTATRQSTLAYTLTTTHLARRASSIAAYHRPKQYRVKTYFPTNDLWSIMTVFTTYAPELLLRRVSVWPQYKKFAQKSMMRHIKRELKGR